MPNPTKMIRLRVTVKNPQYKKAPVLEDSEEEFLNLSENDEENNHEKLHDSGYVLVETGEPTLLGSYSVALLQSVSKQFHCQLDFEQLPLLSQTEEWLKLTQSISDTRENSSFLQKVSNLVLFPESGVDEDVKLERIRKVIFEKFGNFDITLFSNSQEFQPHSSHVLLYREDDRFFATIPRTKLYPTAESRAHSIIADLSSSSLLIKHIKRKLNKEGELFAMHQVCIKDLENLKELRNLEAVLSSEFVPGDAKLFQELQACLVKKVDLGADDSYDEDVDHDGLSSESQNSILLDLKKQIAQSANIALEQAILATRNRHKISQINEVHAADDIKEDVNQAARDIAQKKKELLDLQTQQSEKTRQIEHRIQSLQKEQGLNQLKLKIQTTRPKAAFSYLTKITGIKTVQELISYLQEIGFEDGSPPLREIVSEKDVAELCLLMMAQITSKTSVNYNADQRKVVLQVEANNLFLSECVKKVQTVISQYGSLEKPTLIEIHFKGTNSITFDADLEKIYFHGTNLHFGSIDIFVSSEIQHQLVTIDVSGNDAIEHEKCKPEPKTAFGAHGTDGEHGNPGESGGNVVIHAIEGIHGMEFLEIISVGGKGGRGQDGGDGSDGSNGTHGADGCIEDKIPESAWEDADRRVISRGNPGTCGKAGGDSGFVGLGGVGGIGGEISIVQGNEELKLTPNSDGHHIGIFTTKDGEGGSDGEPGCAGEGGRGGKHGDDKAIVFVDTFWWRRWERHSGNLDIIQQKEWYLIGYNCTKLPPKPPALHGKHGTKKQNHNQKRRTPATRQPHISATAPSSRSTTQNVDYTDYHESVSNLNEELASLSHQQTAQNQQVSESIQELEENRASLENLSAKKAYHDAKIKKCDQLLENVKQMYSTFEKELIATSAQRQAEEAYKMTKEHKQMSSRRVNRESTIHQSEEPRLTNDNLSNFVLDAMTILGNQKSLKAFSAVEKFILVFFEDAAHVGGSLTVLKKLNALVETGNQRIGVFDVFHVTGTLLPLLFQHFPKSEENELWNYFETFSITKDCTTIPEQLCRICEICEKEKFTLERFISSDQSKHLTVKQKDKLHDLLDAIYIAEQVPQLVKLIGKKASEDTDVSRSSEEIFSKLVQKVLEARRKLVRALPKEKIKTIASTLKILTECIQDTKDEASSPGIINRIFEKVDKDLSLEKVVAKILKNKKWEDSEFGKLVFIAEIYEYDTTRLDLFVSASYKQNITEGYARGQRLRIILNTAYQSKYLNDFKSAILTKFQDSGVPEASKKVEQVVSIVESMGTFKERIFVYEAILESQKFDYDSVINLLKSKTLQLDDFLSSCEHFHELEDTGNQVETIRKIQFTLEQGDFPADSFKTIEIRLNHLQQGVSSQKSSDLFAPLFLSLKKSIAQFWERCYHLQVIVPIQQSYASEMFDEWSDAVLNAAGELVSSTKILSKIEYMQYLRLKLGSVHYWSLMSGRIQELSSIELKGGGKEQQRLRHILDELHRFSRPILTSEFNDASLNEVVASLNSIICWNVEEKRKLSEILTKFQTALKDVCTPKHESNLKLIYQDAHMKLLCHWTNVRALSEFIIPNETKADPTKGDNVCGRSPEEENQIKVIFSSMRSSIKPSNRSCKMSKESRQETNEMIGMVERMVLIDQELSQDKLQNGINDAISKLQKERTEIISSLEIKSKLRIQLLMSIPHPPGHDQGAPLSEYIFQCRDRFQQCWKKFETLEECGFMIAMKQAYPEIPAWMENPELTVKSADLEQLQKMDEADIATIAPLLFLKPVVQKLMAYLTQGGETDLCPSVILNFYRDRFEHEVGQILTALDEKTKIGFLILAKCWNELMVGDGGNSAQDQHKKQLVAMHSIKLTHSEGKLTIDKFWEIIRQHSVSPTTTDKNCPLQDKFFNPGTPNGTREYISRLVKSTIPCDEFALILDRFETNDQIDVKHLESLLTEMERHYFNKYPHTIGVEIVFLRSVTDWSSEFQHLFIQQSFENMSLLQSESDKNALIRVLNKWKLELYERGQKKDNITWYKMVTNLLKRVETFPTQYSDVVNFLNVSCTTASLEDMKVVVDDYLPTSYLKEMLLNKLTRTLRQGVPSTSSNVQLVTKIEETVRSFIFGTNNQIAAEFLDNFISEAKGAGLQPILQLFNIKHFSFGADNESVLVACSKIPLPEWRKAFRVPIYKKLISSHADDTKIINLVVEADDKFPEHMYEFVEYLVDGLKVNLYCVSQYFEHFISGQWTLNSDVMQEVRQVTGSEEIATVIDNYMEQHRKQVIGGDQLIKAIQDLNINRDNKDVERYSCTILEDISKIKAKYSGLSDVIGNQPVIRVWDELQVKKWRRALAIKIKEGTNVHSNENKIEVLAVILRGVELFTKSMGESYTLRDTQLASVLLFLNAKQNGVGRFAEIATSEGKTLISSVQAILFALGNANVDVITSSSVLAEDAYQKMCKLFSLFDIGVGNISEKESRKGGEAGEKALEKVYSNTVLFGDAASFETDFLSTKHLDKKYTKGRIADYVIVDEVDSMLLDKGSHVLYISHAIPELRWLKPIFIDIWALVNASVDKITISEKIGEKWIPAEGELKFPQFLRTFVTERIPIWINNALTAKEMTRDIPYVLSPEEDSQETEKVTIIDADTGVEQQHMQYSYGLHQFLELKEDSKISAESLKSVFVSNLGYFSKFKGKIFGITGTLGDDYSRKILGDLYTVDFFKMPRFKLRQCKREPAQFPSTPDSFLSAALNSVETRHTTQPVLFICENKLASDKLYGHLCSHVVAEKLFQINSTAQYEAFREMMEKRKLCAGDVIISTNLAGRGTDIGIDEGAVNGLHVVLTFLPPNRRVEKQAFGRTARAGQKGSTEYIVELAEEEGTVPQTIEFHQREMYYKEKDRLDEIREKQVPRILFEEELFQRLSEKLSNLRSRLSSSQLVLPSGIPGIVSIARTRSKAVVKTMTNIIKNHWAFWLDAVQDKLQLLHISSQGRENIIQEFDSFWSQVQLEAFQGYAVCRSPSDHVKLAKEYEVQGNIVTSAEILDRGIAHEPNYKEILLYYRGVCELRLDSVTEKKTLSRRRMARRCLKLAQAKITQRQQELHDLLGKFKFLEQQAKQMHNDGSNDEKINSNKKSGRFYEQVQNEINMLHFHNDEFLTPALGHTFSPESFKCLTTVNEDEDESRAIFDAILDKSSLFKPNRVSRKLRTNSDNELTHKGKKVEFDCEFDSCKEQLQTFLLKKAKSPQKKVDLNDFLPMIVKREEFLKIVRESDFILQPSEDYTLWDVMYDEDAFIEKFSAFPKLKVTIGMLLSKHNLQSFKENEMKELLSPLVNGDGKRFQNLMDRLALDGYIVQRPHFKAKIQDEVYARLKIVDSNLHGLPEKLQPYSNILKIWLYQRDSSGEATLISKEVDTQHLKGVPFETKLGAEDILNSCVLLGYVKKAKVRWSLGGNFDKENKEKEKIESQFEWDSDCESELISSLHQTFRKYHPNETKNEDFEEYLVQVRDTLVKSIGQIKTLPYLQIDGKYRSLLECYSGGSIPREVMDFVSEDFDRIPKVKEKIPWWCNGATYVALLGVLQIAVGVTVGVLSGGTLANVSAMLISEGGSDIMYAVQAGMTGSFSWKSYAVHKAFSVGASILTGGLAGMTGASLTTIVLMEVAEEIVKKVVWTVGRYAVQGVATTLVNMTIEKALDELRNSLIGTIRTLFQGWAATNDAYRVAKRALHKSLNDLYAATYRQNQAPNLVMTATDVLGVKVKTSIYSHALSVTLQRVASFYTAKLVEKLTSAFGQGIVDKVFKLYKFLTQFSPSVVTRAMQGMQKFAVDYVNGMESYFRSEGDKLRAKQEGRIMHENKMEKAKFDKLRDTFLNQIDVQVADEGVAKFQYEVAEPALKQMSGRWLESKCHNMFKGKHADYSKHASFSSYKQKEGGSLWSRLNTPSVHTATDMNYRAGFDHENRSRNNVWDGVGMLSNWMESPDMLNFVSFPKNEQGESDKPVFHLAGNSLLYVKEAEKLGFPFVRTFWF